MTSLDPVSVFRALGHPARLQIAEALAETPHSAGELVALVGLAGPTVSRHLSVLRQAGITRDQKQGNLVIYELALPCVTSFVACLRAAEARNASARPCARCG